MKPRPLKKINGTLASSNQHGGAQIHNLSRDSGPAVCQWPFVIRMTALSTARLTRTRESSARLSSLGKAESILCRANPHGRFPHPPHFIA